MSVFKGKLWQNTWEQNIRRETGKEVSEIFLVFLIFLPRISLIRIPRPDVCLDRAIRWNILSIKFGVVLSILCVINIFVGPRWKIRYCCVKKSVISLGFSRHLRTFTFSPMFLRPMECTYVARTILYYIFIIVTRESRVLIFYRSVTIRCFPPVALRRAVTRAPREYNIVIQ